MTNNSKWQYFEAEQKGSMHKIWLQCGEQRALFKWSKNEAQNAKEIANELEAYRIATALGLKCAKAENLTFNGQRGILSHNAHTEPQKFLYVSAKNYAAQLRNNPNIKTPPRISFGGMSVEYVQKHIPGAEKDMVNMLLFDCLTNNSDRHGDNWELKINKKTTKVVGLCDMFDHDNSFRPEPSLKNSGCAIRYYEIENINQKDMLKNLSADYPRQVGEFLYKARQLVNSAELPDLCADRLAQMERYYSFCSNLKRTQNREVDLSSRFANTHMSLPASIVKTPAPEPEFGG